MNVPSESSSKSGAAPSTLAELRENVNDIGLEIAAIAERRGRQVGRSAQAGTSELRRQIRRQPVVAIGVATLAGALLALLVVPRASRLAVRSRRDAWMPPVSRADLYDFGEGLQRSFARAAHSVPLTSSFERLVEAITKVEPTASMNSIVDKLGSWLQRAQSAAAQVRK